MKGLNCINLHSLSTFVQHFLFVQMVAAPFTTCFCLLQSNVFDVRVCFKPITWYIEWKPREDIFFSVWRHDFFVLRDVHSQRVYLQEESLLRFSSATELSAWPLFIS